MDGSPLMAVWSLFFSLLLSLVIVCLTERKWDIQFMHIKEGVKLGGPLDVVPTALEFYS